MSQFYNFSSGSSGVLNINSETNFSPTDASCSGTAGASSFPATISVSAGDMLLIHQTRGTSANKYEIVQVSSYSSGTVNLVNPLVNTYTDNGNSQAQVIKLPQYSAVNITSTLNGKAWDGNVGGIIPILCSGKCSITGTVNLAGKGFRGGAGIYTLNHSGTVYAYCGEGTGGASARQNTANGNGGGADGSTSNGSSYTTTGGGAGGGNGTAGENGEDSTSHTSPQALGGVTTGNDTLTEAPLGGGGGGPVRNTPGPLSTGGIGGGLFIVFADEFDCSSGTINLSGTNGQGYSDTGQYEGAGAGSGGSFLLISRKANIGTNRINLKGGIGGAPYPEDQKGGDGGKGRFRAQVCSLTGSLSSDYYGSYSTSIGGHSFCGIYGGML